MKNQLRITSPWPCEKKLDLIMLHSDVTIEDNFVYYYAGKDVNLFVNGIPFENEVLP
jgi:hypothetical protein